MAERGSSLSSWASKMLLLYLCYFSLLGNIIPSNCEHVYEFEKRDVGFDEYLQQHQKRSTSSDEICSKQEKDHLTDFIGEGTKRLEVLHVFDNDSNAALALTWAGRDGVLIVVTTTEVRHLFSPSPSGHSTLYRSTNNGRTFFNISDKIDNAFIRKSAGLQRNSHTPRKVYLISPGHPDYNIYVSDDGGLSFSKHILPFALDGTFKYHPERDDWMLARSLGLSKKLYLSTSNGEKWTKIKDGIADYKWATPESQEDWESCVYVTVNVGKRPSGLMGLLKPYSVKRLEKSCDKGQTWKVLLKNVHSFGIEGKFMYASVTGNTKDERVMKVSTDGGQTWSLVHLPTIVRGQFYSILDMSEGLVFIHVDKPGDSGYGNLYMSAGKGIIFSESLKYHLYPNFGTINDFYPVKSLRGVYITSQMLTDKSIRTMISFNRGGSWSTIRRPPHVPCKDESKACYLQIHNAYSKSRAIQAEAPLSVESAVGLILVHGHVAEALQTTPPDVFVSDDGGYSWILALKGPHQYQIADNGGLLVALPKTRDHKATMLKFSVDEGRCWHEYKFSDDPIIVTGLLTEPGSKSATVGIWGFGATDKKWRTFVVDFTKIVKNKCTQSDYQKWRAHSDHRANEKGDMSGCLLGVRETFTRLKKDSWCINGYDFKPSRTSEKCTCTREDFECDYSYVRPVGQDKCIKEKGFNPKEEIDVCLRGHEDEIITEGYRKIPGDNCTGGVNLGDKVLNLGKICDSNKPLLPELITTDAAIKKEVTAASHKKIVLIIVGLTAICLVLFLAGVFIYKFYFYRKNTMNYRYSLLHHSEDRDFDGEFESALTSVTRTFEDSEDEKLSRVNTENGKLPRYHDDSDVEMLE